ncbi:MAG: cyclic nucleotide-binding domain-containing protein [Candidatus Marinimicrobia bacterium]|nr:cyclic nucleotide-binding domain-containing protein [Candidatus Neomarinimicrobiota bacterium]MCF7921316.1 cyclic nucleotide-binding domain-containing protein [Candidatus Neomarinimicrobiota bacterium]
MKLIKKPALESLKKWKIFEHIPEAELKQIHAKIEYCHYDHEESIIRENSIGDHIFVLASGKVRIEKQVRENQSEVLGFYDEVGGLFGEMALLEDKPRSAGMVADTDCEVLAVSKEDFLELVHSVPLFTLSVAKNISQFLRETDERLINKLRKENDELRHMNYLLQETQEELIGKERLSLIGRMASTILHDMKNPMSTIGGYAQLIKMKKHSAEQLAKYADIIAKQVIQFTTMTQDLLSFAQGGEQMRLRSVQMGGYLQECCDSLVLKFEERGITFVRDLNFEGEVRIDNGRFFRVLENIANNALDVLDSEGTFTVHSMEVETGIRIILEDNGRGMSTEVMENAFKEFYTYGKRKGTGLGLAIVKRIIDEHDGLIYIDSEEGVGSRFIIDLPAVGYNLLPKSKHQLPIPFAGS